MAKIVLISCVSKKLALRSRAEDLYVSPLFRKNLKYARSLKPDQIFILSALHGLVGLDDEIEPYDKTLNKMDLTERKVWADRVLEKLRDFDLEKDKFVFLAGENYRKFLIPHLRNYEVPMLGLGIGRQLRWLSERIGHE